MSTPIDITREFVAAHAARFDDALEIVKNEFKSLDADSQYTNAFARLLKWDPLERALMLGTDQRELFVPVLKDLVRAQRRAAASFTFFDIGCGDGQTFALAADEFPDGATGVILDPNAYYVAQCETAVRAAGRLYVGRSICAPFLPETGVDVPDGSGGFDLILAIHVLYYFDELRESLARIYELLKPGGAAFIVFADEKTAYTGQALRAYHRGDTAFLASFDQTCDLRRRLLLPGADGLVELQRHLDERFPASRAHLRSEVQASRLYGHTLVDILALSLITGLDRVETPKKFDAVMELIRTRPEAIGLRIERGRHPAREGMLSVGQSQIVVELRREAR